MTTAPRLPARYCDFSADAIDATTPRAGMPPMTIMSDFLPHVARVCERQDAVFRRGHVRKDQRAKVYRDRGIGRMPTIVMGGFVPDSTEQVMSMRAFLRGAGDVYYMNYPRFGFSTELFLAQLDDLVTELSERRGQRPVLFGVSFGAALVVEWLAHARRARRARPIAGTVLISPVTCVADLVARGEPAATSLVGRAIEAYLDGPATKRTLERSQALFTRMFESGLQKLTAASLGPWITDEELVHLRHLVKATIAGLTLPGVYERVQALGRMPLPEERREDGQPLSRAPALVLYAEKESTVLAETSPARRAFEETGRAYFPRGACHVVRSERGNPVPHASLLIHRDCFFPRVETFYASLTRAKEAPAIAWVRRWADSLRAAAGTLTAR
jgi:pimeloyl-ACP methyl ester carboxylesterase